jgi:hypothetical protein
LHVGILATFAQHAYKYSFLRLSKLHRSAHIFYVEVNYISIT